MVLMMSDGRPAYTIDMAGWAETWTRAHWTSATIGTAAAKGLGATKLRLDREGNASSSKSTQLSWSPGPNSPTPAEAVLVRKVPLPTGYIFCGIGRIQHLLWGIVAGAQHCVEPNEDELGTLRQGGI